MIGNLGGGITELKLFGNLFVCNGTSPLESGAGGGAFFNTSGGENGVQT